MAKVTIEIPDELATRLQPLREQLPEMLTQFIESISGAKVERETEPKSETYSVYAEVLDFLLMRPTPQEIIDFKVSNESQKPLQILLAKNRETSLTPEEVAELDVFEQLEHLMILLKARADNSIN